MSNGGGGGGGGGAGMITQILYNLHLSLEVHSRVQP